MDSPKSIGYRDFEWAVKLNRASLQLLGLWPKAEQIPRERIKSNLRVLIVFLFFVVGILLPYFQSLIRIYKDLTLVIEHLQFILSIGTCTIKVVVLWWKREAVIPIINMITRDWLKSKSTKERNMMIIWARRARRVTTLAYSIITLSFICAVFLPFFGISLTYMVDATHPDKLLPFHAYHIYNITKSPQYELTYIANAIMIFFGISAYTGIDSFLGFLVFHICGQIDILRNRLVCSNNKLVKFHDILKNCVRNHIRLLRTINTIDDTYNIMLLVIFLYFGILFAFYGFLIVSIFDENNGISKKRLIFLICNILNVFVHAGLYCAVGEILVAQSNKIHYAIYNQEWYSLNPKMAKNLILLMIRSSEPCYITAGKIFPMTMLTFCNVVKTSAGYVSFLLTTRN